MRAIFNALAGLRLAAQAAAPVDPAARVFASAVASAEQRAQVAPVDRAIDKYTPSAARPARARRR